MIDDPVLTDFDRLILYYPVSALVTLFANILQNPQDARARSDLKLMSSVVAFLTMLERDITESAGNVRRMLSVCAEFERIAKVVLDKAERDLKSSRGKRKAGATGTTAHAPTEREKEKALRERGVQEKEIEEALGSGKTLEQMQVETQASYRRPVNTPSLRQSQASGSVGAANAGASPASWGGSQPGGTGSEYKSPPSQQLQHLQQEMWQPQQQHIGLQNRVGQWMPNVQMNGGTSSPGFPPPDFNNMANGGGVTQSPPMQTSHPPPAPASFSEPQAGLTDGFAPNTDGSAFNSMPDTSMMSMDSLHNNNNPPVNGNNGMGNGGGMGGSFQQPFVPQDLWQMPMTLEWDWAEGFGLGSYAPGYTGNFDMGDGFMPGNGMGADGQ